MKHFILPLAGLLSMSTISNAQRLNYPMTEKTEQVDTYFGTKVDVKVAGNGKGKITIPFHSEEDFNRIIKLIKG